MSDELQNMMKGLSLHFLHQKTVAQAIEEGREAGIPEELLSSLPGMMFEVTSAACAVHTGGRTVSSVAKQMMKKVGDQGAEGDFDRDDAVSMIRMTLEFIKELERKGGPNSRLPELTQPWFRYPMTGPTS